MSGSRDVNHVEVALRDESVEMDVNEVLSRGCAKVSQQSGLDVLEAQGLSQERVLVQQIDLHRHTCESRGQSESCS